MEDIKATFLARIKKINEKKQTQFIFSAKGLTECPAEIGTLTHLTQLDLSNNYLSITNRN